MKHYNLVLVFVSFQRCCIYLSLIRELSGKFRVSVCPQQANEKTIIRTQHTIDTFLKLCVSYGADLIYDEKISADITILPQSDYTPETIQAISNHITSKKIFWLSGLAMGNAQHEFLCGKKIDKILVVDRSFYKFRVREYEGIENKIFKDEDIIEIGVPYKKYPVFPDYGIDYLLANPTPFSFCCVDDRLEYVENVYALIQKTDEDDLIVLKPHNADERVDYIVDARLYFLLTKELFRPFLNVIDSLSRRIANVFKRGRVHDFFVNVSIAVIYAKFMKRVVPFRDITEYHNLNLELFLPNVKKGMITGRSNSIWHGLFNRLPVYNCIDENKSYFSETKMHKYSMKYLDVHGNYHSLKFDDRLFEKVETHTIKADAVKVIAEQISQIQ